MKRSWDLCRHVCGQEGQFHIKTLLYASVMAFLLLPIVVIIIIISPKLTSDYKQTNNYLFPFFCGAVAHHNLGLSKD